jgi:hypothetical protein
MRRRRSLPGEDAHRETGPSFRVPGLDDAVGLLRRPAHDDEGVFLPQVIGDAPCSGTESEDCRAAASGRHRLLAHPGTKSGTVRGKREPRSPAVDDRVRRAGQPDLRISSGDALRDGRLERGGDVESDASDPREKMNEVRQIRFGKVERKIDGILPRTSRA